MYFLFDADILSNGRNVDATSMQRLRPSLIDDRSDDPTGNADADADKSYARKTSTSCRHCVSDQPRARYYQNRRIEIQSRKDRQQN